VVKVSSAGVATWYAIGVTDPPQRTFFVRVTVPSTSSTTNTSVPPAGPTLATCEAAVSGHFFPGMAKPVQFGADGYGGQAIAYPCGNEKQLFAAMSKLGPASQAAVSQMVSDVCGAVPNGTLCLHLSPLPPTPATPTTTGPFVVNTAAVQHEIAVQLGRQVAETLTVTCPPLASQSTATCQTSAGLPIFLKLGLRTVTWGGEDVAGVVDLVFAG
jgi:hypothetical protein